MYKIFIVVPLLIALLVSLYRGRVASARLMPLIPLIIYRNRKVVFFLKILELKFSNAGMNKSCVR